MKKFLRNYRISIPTAVAVIAALSWVAFGYFGVHKLFVDDKVDEALPTFDAPEPTAAPTTTAPPATTDIVSPTTVAPTVAPTTVSNEPVVEASGSFMSRAHPTSGEAIVLGNGTGQRFLRFEQFVTDNGPDLKVYLVNSSAGGVNDFVSLGALKGNIGDQNYEVPAGLDLSVYDTVLIWCERFASPFGDAMLQPA